MEELKQKIMAEGTAMTGGIIKVDSFLNHQIDPQLMYRAAQEFIKRFENEDYNKILTIEASGIAPAIMVGFITGKPVVFAKKAIPKTMNDAYVSEIFSFTKKESRTVYVSREFLKKGDRILFIDDFLANGDTAMGISNIIKFAEAELVGMGFIIEKSFQQGAKNLRELGIRVESLAMIESTEGDQFHFRN